MSRAVFLQSRVARRLVFLFLLCALVPVSALAVVAYRQVSAGLAEQAGVNLRRESKVAGAILLDRLLAAKADIERINGSVRSSGIPDSSDLTGFSWIAIVGADRSVTRVSREPPPRIAISILDQERLRTGKVWLGTTAGDRPEILMGVQLPGADSGDRYLIGKVPGRRLWGEVGAGSIAPDDVDLCVRTPELVGLFASTPEACERAARRDGSTITEAQTLFLGYEFGAPSWQVVSGQPAGVVLGPIAQFRLSFLLVVLLAIGAVFILTNVQVRRTMAPLDALMEGTRKVGSGQLDHVVAVQTDDEFKGLAESFNRMAGGLRQQFGFLQSLSELERTALADPRTESIREAALRTAAEAAPDGWITLALPAATGDGAWTARNQDGGPAAPIRLSQAEIECLSRAPWTEGEAAEFPSLAKLVDRHRTRHLVIPLQSRDQLHGALMISAGSDQVADPDRRRQLQLIATQAALALASVANVERLDEMSWGSLTALARTIDAASPWTAGHSERVTNLAVALGRTLELDQPDLETLHRGGLLHDIGKIGIPAAILDKPGPLDRAERARVVDHPLIGARILAPVPVFQSAIPLVRWHHELLDGTGYPDGLAGEQIPRLVRILTVADIFDALTSERPYRPAWPVDKALAHLRGGAGKQFDLEAVEALERWLATAGAGSMVLPSVKFEPRKVPS